MRMSEREVENKEEKHVAQYEGRDGGGVRVE